MKPMQSAEYTRVSLPQILVNYLVNYSVKPSKALQPIPLLWVALFIDLLGGLFWSRGCLLGGYAKLRLNVLGK